MKNSDMTLSPKYPCAQLETATFGGGCFWCLEAVYQELVGVQHVVSGYAGGYLSNPSYEDICTGDTGHAEVVKIEFDPKQISFEELLKIFFVIHDPTTLNRQGNDIGTQYRSVIFYHTEAQERVARQFIRSLEDMKVFGAPIVTEILPIPIFYPAEDYHQNYYRNNPYQGYCMAVVAPKLKKFRDLFSEKGKK